MATPLSPANLSSLNSTKSPSPMQLSTPSKLPVKTMPSLVPSNVDEDEIQWDEGPSSPFVTEIPEDQENSAMASVRSQSVMTEDILRFNDDEITASIAPISAPQTPFKIAEDETSTFQTVKTSISSSVRTSPSKVTYLRSSSYSSHEEKISSTRYIDENHSVQQYRIEEPHPADITSLSVEDSIMDDTCFSTFSQVPDMTSFAKLGQQSPTKQFMFDQETPRPRSSHTPGTARTQVTRYDRSPSPTPRRGPETIPQYQDSSDTTNLLLDFTQQFESVSMSKQSSRTPSRRSPTKNEPHLLSYLHNQRSPTKGGQASAFATPRGSGKILNLLDFELPPAPTPRSVPSITIRELESLKSKFSSEISSLRATLSGREAEVAALKKSVSEAEQRVGQSAELLREEQNKREYAEKEKAEWERRGRDFEEVLRKVKEEVLEAEKERTDMMSRIEEAEERAREADSRAADAEARAIEASTKIVDTGITSSDADGHSGPLFTAEHVQKQIDEKVHSLSTELHAIYKKKHVTKVAGLKKGFEAKTKEKTAELQSKVEELEREKEELQSRFDATLSGVLPKDFGLAAGNAEQREEDLRRIEEMNVLIERQKAELIGKDTELATSRSEFVTLMRDLERERVEKGELVAAVDEMLLMQEDISTVNAAAGTMVDDFKKSVSGLSGIAGARPSGLRGPVPSGLKGPGFGSRIGAPSGLARSQSGGKSRMMSNIERMAGGRNVE